MVPHGLVLIFVCCILIAPAEFSLPRLTEIITGQFPDGFIWGVASSNYQMEGAVYQDGKGESVWDKFAHEHPQFIKNGSNADIADNSYNLWPEDIQQLKLMGLKHYRISIAWERILPNGLAAKGVNMEAVRHYRIVFEALLDAGITPYVTICHYDLPQALADLGGWFNPKIIDWYTDYARICFQSYGDIIKNWLTFNSPALTAMLLEGTYLVNSKLSLPEIIECLESCTYKTVHSILLAHAKSYHMYNAEFRSSQKGKVGIIADCEWYGPGTDSEEDVAAANRAIQFELGWVLHPIIKGDYPPVMKETIARRSQNQSKSRLPEFTEQEIHTIKGTFDYIGLNTYTAFNTFAQEAKPELSSILGGGNGPKNQSASAGILGKFFGPNLNIKISQSDREVVANVSEEWPLSGDGFRHFYPVGIRKLLKWIKEEYENPLVFISENGWADTNGSTNDPWRVDFLEQSINNVLQAYSLDGCNVIGYFAWAFLDAFEWQFGYEAKFGLIKVDQNDPERKRFPKLSFRYFAQLARDNGFVKPKAAYQPYLNQRLRHVMANF